MRYISTKALFILFIVCIQFQKAFSQTNYITLTTCDTTITDPSTLGPGTGYYYLTVKSANNTRIGFSVNSYNSNYGDVYIYEGLNNTGTVLSHLGDPFSLPNQVFGGQSASTAITIGFPAHTPGSPEHFAIRVRCVQTPTATTILQPMKALYASGNAKAADYDKDGDQDLLIGGKILRNDSYFDSVYKFERRPNVIDNWNHANLCSADFDGDGYKDIFITGNSSVFGGLIGPRAAIYRNNGNNTFSLVTPQAFTGATRGGCSIVDYNNDGRPDICYTGSTDYWNNNNLVFKVYLNNGNMSFTDAGISLPGITGLINASMSWADSDGDGDLDLLVNGHKGNANVTALYTRAGNTFTNQNLTMTPTSMGSISWVDVNMDGKPDIVNTGVETPDNVNAIVPEIYMNNGNNNFTFVTTNLPRFAFVSSDWNDYDGDHDKDILLGGWTLPTGTGSDAGIYKNNGNGQFTKVSSLDGANESTRLQWTDINHDGRPDIVGGSYFIKNMGADSFRIASFSATTYDNYPNTTIVDDFNNDGNPDIFIAGESQVDVDCNYKNASTLVIGRGWRLSAIPKFTEVKDLTSLNPIVSSTGFPTEYYYDWADFDSDGKLDVVMSGDNSAGTATNFLVAYKNNGNNNFSLLFNSQATPLPQAPYAGFPEMRYVGIFDIDNDGVNELFLTPNIVYKKSGNQWVLSTYSTTNAAGGAKYMDFADYDHDGFTDAVVTGGNTFLFKNDGAGRMVNVSPPPSGYSSGWLTSESERQIQWVDFDNDGDMDILTSFGVMENRAGAFSLIRSMVPSFVHAAMADINNDGVKDLITVPRMTDDGPMKLYYGEQNTGFFAEQSMGTLTNRMLTQINYNNAVLSFDVDNDGDNDIIYSGGGNCTTGAQVIVNEGNFSDRTIHVVSPNGGELIGINNTAVIKWFGYQVGSTVKIEISRDSGATWQLIAASAASTTSGGSYAWVVTGPASVKCLIRITDNTYMDKSDAVFTIAASVVPVANAGPDATICAGSSITLGGPSAGVNVYSWTSNSGNFTSALANPIVAPAVTTTYFLAVSNGTLTARDTVVITVSPVHLSLPDTALHACIGSSYVIGPAPQAGYTYNWTSVPAGFTSTLANPLISPVEETMYYLHAVSGNGCPASAQVHVTADSCNTGLVLVFPNPAHNHMTVRLSPIMLLPANFKLINTSGAVVFSTLLTSPSTVINTSSIQPGIYFYTVQPVSGQPPQSGLVMIVH